MLELCGRISSGLCLCRIMETKAAYNELPRVSELRDYSISSNLPNAYFWANDDKLTNPYKRKAFAALESELQGLDYEAWEFLKGEVLPRLRSRHPTRERLQSSRPHRLHECQVHSAFKNRQDTDARPLGPPRRESHPVRSENHQRF
jgi:hypothetical protein